MKILVVVDMQNDFIDGALGTAEAAVIVPKVVEKIRGWTGEVYATQDTHQADYLTTQEGRNLPVPHCVEGTHGWDLAPAVREALTDFTCLTKPTFGSRSLAETLVIAHQHQPIEEIVLVGLCTDICVISNALLLKAFLPEVPIRVDAACCAGVTPESHRNALAAMRQCQIAVDNG
ncbi:MAG: cysteine hydrolase [Oscillibacter sp.]|nr:cysteine hydrolase [Oscillibacter sp.]